MLQIERITFSANDILDNVVPIYNTKFGRMVNARELHFALGIKKKFADWVKMYTKHYSGYNYGSTEKDPEYPEQYDYFSFEVKAKQFHGRKIEYYLCLDLAKEITMMTKSVLGKKVRKYFIEAERTLRKVHKTLTAENKTNEEKLAEALLLSQQILSEKDIEIKKANRNREYNKKVNSRLRKELRHIKKNQIEEFSKLISEKDEIIEYMEGSIEHLEDQNAQLKSRLNYLISIKLDGRSILNAFTAIDVARRQRFAINQKGKEEARVKAYVFRKDAILNAGIVLNNDPGKSLVENINVNDIEQAVVVYIAALKKAINNEELFEELFDKQLKRANEFLEKIAFEKQNEEELQEQLI